MQNLNRLFFLLWLLNANQSKALDTLDVFNFSHQKGLQLSVKGLGGYQEYCVAVCANNASHKAVYLKVEPGTFMIPEDTSLQDLLVIERAGFLINPGQKIVGKLRAYCAAYYNHSPEKDSEFNAFMGSPKLVALAKYLNNHRKVQDVQQAVWVVANGCLISSINRNEDSLVKFVSKLTGQPIPEYTAEFMDPTGTQLFTNRVSRIKGEIAYTVVGEDVVSFQVYDQKGRLRKTIFTGRWAKRGTHIEKYDIDVAKLNKGVYFIKVYQQNQLISEQRFEI